MHNTYAYINESIDNIFKIKCRQNFPPKNLWIVKNNLGFFCSRINRKITRNTNKYQTLVNSGR